MSPYDKDLNPRGPLGLAPAAVKFWSARLIFGCTGGSSMLERFHPARLFAVSVTDNTRSDRSSSQDSSGVTE